MKKILIILFTSALCTTPTLAQEGLLTVLITEKKEQLKPEHPFAKGAIILGLAAITASEYHATQRKTRSSSSALSSLFSVALGVTGTAFLVYYFIGNEMAQIISFKKTLEHLEKDISIWQALLPQLQENQGNVSKKLQAALGVLSTITPLVHKLAIQDTASLNDPRFEQLQEEICSLKNLVMQLSSTTGSQHTAAFAEKMNVLLKTSATIFGQPKTT